jgi:cystathionine gamma-synthase/methionine-gamma-lyase
VSPTEPPEPQAATRVVHSGAEVHRAPSSTWPLAAPIVQTSVYVYPDLNTVDAVHEGDQPGYIYGRYGLPNHRALEAALAELEGAEAAIATTNGTNAIASTLFGLLAAGDRIVAGINIYGGTRGLLDYELSRFGVSTSYVHPADPQAIRDAMYALPRPTMLWIDSIANPTMLVSDIPMLAALAHEAGALLIVDNTFATPLHCNPLALGADLVVHSATKFIGGHNDTSAGAVLGPATIIDPIRRVAIRMGAVGAPFEAWLALRGLRTMEVRLRRSSASAQRLAEALAHHPRVRRVHYPGLATDPGHLVALRVLHAGHGSMLAIDLGDADTARQTIDRLRLIQIAETLGGLMTTVVHPRSASYRALTAEQLAHIGVSEGLIRLSVGIEASEDLLADLTQALIQGADNG